MAKNLARSVGNKGKPNAMTGEEDLEPVLKERLERYRSIEDWRSTPSDSIRSTGYVVDSLEAALWAFFSTENFEQGAIRAVNLGDDADTIGAIYGGLAGAFYSTDAIPKHWLADMKRIEIVDEIIEDIIDSSSTSSTNNHDRGHSQRYTETMSSNDRDGTTVRRTHEETGKPTLDETYHSPPTRNRGAARITDDDNAASDQGRIQDVTDVDVDPSDQEEKDRQYLESMEDE
ncbi:hypothetical protein H2204_005508 [Knufia peltigerae]|uniref:ADP-ribosylhydrolase ARH3 n=1 Tax=Knufia peltigerae TaxID=1002370 RepID=A0AA38Y574_9EURO|nr:hypothetical protein H2204_005508 [Knufia peltigerae]